MVNLMDTIKNIYKAVYETHQIVCAKYNIKPILPNDIHFATTDDMIIQYPDLSPKERENVLCQEYGAVFLIGIGGTRNDTGELRHDGRAPDYDDWTTPREDGGTGLNGDLILWNPLLQMSFEISSMGMHVNRDVLLKQLELCHCLERKDYAWHHMSLNGTLPQTIGGGIGQSRLCQFMLQCPHIGEVQHAWYNPEEVELLKKYYIMLLGLGEFNEDPMALSLHPGITLDIMKRQHNIVTDDMTDPVTSDTSSE